MRCKIVVADDNQDAAETLAVLLELDGHQVALAGNGEKALELIMRIKPDLALLDIGMPEMNGYEVARRVRNSEFDQQVFLVAVTGWGQAQDVQRAMDAGFNVHFVKPVEPDAIKAICAQLERRISP